MLSRNIQTKVKLRAKFVIESTKKEIEDALRAASVTIGDWQAGGLDEIKLISYEPVECDKLTITFAVQCHRPIGMDGSTDETAKDSILAVLKK
jgi:hypothetical protein